MCCPIRPPLLSSSSSRILLTAVAMLDCYDLSNEVILVMERPVSCVDLIQYLRSRKDGLREHEAKGSI